MIKLEDYEPPLATAGVETIRCECGWETTHIIPEEHHAQLIAVIKHLQFHDPNIKTFRLLMH